MDHTENGGENSSKEGEQHSAMNSDIVVTFWDS